MNEQIDSVAVTGSAYFNRNYLVSTDRHSQILIFTFTPVQGVPHLSLGQALAQLWHWIKLAVKKMSEWMDGWECNV